MDIYVNGKFLTQRMTGVQRYAYELTRSLIALGVDLKVIVPPHVKTGDTGLPLNRIIKTGRLRNVAMWEQLELPALLRKAGDPLLLSLCNTGPLLVKNHAVCIHDMSYMENPAWFSKSFYLYYQFMIPQMLKRAKHVITVSEFSRNEISSKLRFPREKISVVYNAPAEQFLNTSEEAINYIKKDFFLVVGSLDPRKNLKTLTEVFSSDELREYYLVVVGAASKTFNFNGSDLSPNIHLLETCDDKTLSRLYRKARGLINCSFYEGFGLPVVEAMASGCPLLLSDIPVFREIAGNNACFFSPDSPESIKNALTGFLKEDSLVTNTLIHENYMRSLGYDWRKSGMDLMNVLKMKCNELHQ